jgi:hypothetical protein
VISPTELVVDAPDSASVLPALTAPETDAADEPANDSKFDDEIAPADDVPVAPTTECAGTIAPSDTVAEEPVIEIEIPLDAITEPGEVVADTPSISCGRVIVPMAEDALAPVRVVPFDGESTPEATVDDIPTTERGIPATIVPGDAADDNPSNDSKGVIEPLAVDAEELPNDAVTA